MANIACIVPTIREESYKTFLAGWKHLFERHGVLLIKVVDGDEPYAEVTDFRTDEHKRFELKGSEAEPLVYNRNDGVRNFGFYLIAKYYPIVDTIQSYDDDLLPEGDPIQDHLDALNQHVPVSWIKTSSEYMRGFPYCIRNEAEVVLSHGTWNLNCDYDAPTQLVLGMRSAEHYKMTIPKGVYFTFCGMSIAFKRKLLPYMYYAPMGYKVGMDRFADIFLGVVVKRIIDEKGWAVVSGYSTVNHLRASNVWANLKKESNGLPLNETFWSGDESDPYFKLYAEKRKAWEELINECTL